MENTDKKKSDRIGLVIPYDLKEKAKLVADMEHRNLSNLIVSLIYDYVEKKLHESDIK